MTLTGINFFGGSYAYLRFNGVYPIQSDYLSYSSTKIVIKVPAGAFSGPISVITEYGQSQTNTPFKVKPTVKSFAPASGAVGTAVTIKGSAFLDATSVTFGGVPASFVLVSYGKISATVPAGAITGRIVVTTPSGKATSKTDFTVT